MIVDLCRTAQKDRRGVLHLVVLHEVNNRVHARVQENSEYGDVIEYGGEVGGVAETHHEVVDLVHGPAQGKEHTDKGQGMDHITLGLGPQLVLLLIARLVALRLSCVLSVECVAGLMDLLLHRIDLLDSPRDHQNHLTVTEYEHCHRQDVVKHDGDQPSHDPHPVIRPSCKGVARAVFIDE